MLCMYVSRQRKVQYSYIHMSRLPLSALAIHDAPDNATVHLDFDSASLAHGGSVSETIERESRIEMDPRHSRTRARC
jgi:hypothetical protein